MGAALLKRNADVIMLRRGTPPREAESPLDRLLQQQGRKQLERLLKSYDDKQARKQAERLAKRVLAEYPKTKLPYRVSDEEAPLFMPRRAKEPTSPHPQVLKWLAESGKKWAAPKLPSYAERAEALLFELTQLNVGQPAPPVQGRDAFGKEFHLSDYKGKVVVLMFSANWCGPCKQLYPALRELQKKFAGKPLEVVTVMADSEPATVRQAIDKGDITWRAVWDGDGGPIASKWNVRRFPTLYVLDRHGVIRARDSQDRLADVVAELLKGEK
jgi:thiol-disulfide isomerase/thioredoxin